MLHALRFPDPLRLPLAPVTVTAAPPRAYLRDIYVKEGPAAFAAAVRAHKGAVSTLAAVGAHWLLIDAPAPLRWLVTLIPSSFFLLPLHGCPSAAADGHDVA